MIIIHKIDDFLSVIFPEINKNDEQSIVKTFKDYYTFGTYLPIVTTDGVWVKIEIDTSRILTNEAEFKKVVSFCEKGNYSAAKPILRNLIKNNPTVSEYHRIMGQILSDEGDQEEAINCLIDALRWDSKNGWALLMMGNIFAKFKNDITTATKYYDQALIANPKDNITINNIAANLLQQGKTEEAKKYFWEAIKINDKYPNSHFALGVIATLEGDLHSAFYSTVQAIKLNKNRDVLFQNSVKQAFEIANKITSTDEGKKIYRKYRQKLEQEGNKRIDIVRDEDIPTAAKFEFAENYDREIHLVRYKPSYPAVEHLIMHELVHLEFVIQARKEKVNKLFISNGSNKSQFVKGLEPTMSKLNKLGVSKQSVNDYCSNLFEGMNRQIFNTPIDLFIEQFLFLEFAELRPFQFISLYTLIQEGLKAVTDKKVVELSPKDIISKSKIYNLVNAIQFRELFGLDFIKDYNATVKELNTANEFYEEYLEYVNDKKPAEEYDLVLNWAQDLNLEKNFELIDEDEFRNKRLNIDNLLESIENDPFELESSNAFKRKEMEQFKLSQETIGTNMAIVMFMVDALKFFEGMPKREIKQIAFEIAMQGTQGYRPDTEGYKISSIKGKTFSGYHILAYYYVSWALAIPEMLSETQLPYDEEYKLASTFFNNNKPC